METREHRFEGEILPEARPEAGWPAGKGVDGLAMARSHWQEEMRSREQLPDISGKGRDAWAIEGVLNGEVVYRENSPGGNVPENMDNVPEEMKDKVSYTVMAYRLSQ